MPVHVARLALFQAIVSHPSAGGGKLKLVHQWQRSVARFALYQT